MKRVCVQRIVPVDIGAAMIEGLASAWNGPQSETFERGMRVLRKYVPFGGAWWGLIDGPPDIVVKPIFHLAGAIDLSKNLCDEYAKICGEDQFAAAVVANPGEVLRWSEVNESVPPSICDWIDRHQIVCGAARCTHAAFIDQAFVVVLYRFKGGLAFSDQEALAIDLLVKQLEILWAKNVQEMCRLSTVEALTGTLLAKEDGSLIYCGAELSKRLAAMGWNQQGQLAPQNLIELAQTGGRVKTSKDWIVVTPGVDGFRAQLSSTIPVPSMPMRLLRVASMTCDGTPAKEIARELGLSPSTVRTYLREVYRNLGVHNKLELLGALQAGNRFTRLD